MLRRKSIRNMLLMGGTSVIPWYRSGGISNSNVLGVWDAKNATSYASSKVSLANPSAANLLADGAAFPAWAAGTGWTFTAASLQYLTIATAIATAAPLSMVCRFSPAAVNVDYYLISINNNVATNLMSLIAAGSVGGDPINAQAYDGTNGQASSTAAFAAGYYTACAVFTSNILRAAYIDGGNGATEYNRRNPRGVNCTSVGARINGGGGTQYYMNGVIVACAIYNIALSDAQVLSIHNAMAIL